MNNHLKKIISWGIFAGVFMMFCIVPMVTSAVDTAGNPTQPISIYNPLKGGAQTIPDLLVLIIDSFIMPIGGIIVVVMFIYTGFMFVMAQGNSSEITKAKASLFSTIIGAAIVLSAYAMSTIIQNTVGQITDAVK